MERILRNAPFSASMLYTEDGVAVDPGTVTIGVTRADGTVVVAAGTATTGTAAAPRAFTLTLAHTALLDTLTLTWTSASKGIRTSTIEVVGGFLFSVADARAIKPLDNTSLYTTARIIAFRTLAEQALEHACGVAFVPRYRLDSVDGAGAPRVVVSRPRVTAIRSVSVTDIAGVATAFTVGELAATRGGPTRIVTSQSSFADGWANVAIGYEHGYPDPPMRASQACLRLAKRWLIEGPVDDRATSVSNDDGTFALVTPGVRGVMFDIPEVNAVVQQYGYVTGFA